MNDEMHCYSVHYSDQGEELAHTSIALYRPLVATPLRNT